MHCRLHPRPRGRAAVLAGLTPAGRPPLPDCLLTHWRQLPPLTRLLRLCWWMHLAQLLPAGRAAGWAEELTRSPGCAPAAAAAAPAHPSPPPKQKRPAPGLHQQAAATAGQRLAMCCERPAVECALAALVKRCCQIGCLLVRPPPLAVSMLSGHVQQPVHRRQPGLSIVQGLIRYKYSRLGLKARHSPLSCSRRCPQAIVSYLLHLS